MLLNAQMHLSGGSARTVIWEGEAQDAPSTAPGVPLKDVRPCRSGRRLRTMNSVLPAHGAMSITCAVACKGVRQQLKGKRCSQTSMENPDSGVKTIDQNVELQDARNSE